MRLDEAAKLFHFKWELPKQYSHESIARRISWDGQIYLSCNRCGWVDRHDVPAVSGSATPDRPCQRCGANDRQSVRYLDQRNYHCEDCDEEFQVEITGFEEVQCPQCLSDRLSLKSSAIFPPFPPRFGQLAVPKEHSWGESVIEDSEFIFEEITRNNLFPDFPLYLLVMTRFCRRLRMYCDYKEERADLQLLNLEATLFRRHFKKTKALPTGLEALALYEGSVQLAAKGVQQALIEHNVAIAVNSLLSVYPETLICLLTQRQDVRLGAVATAKRALREFESGSRQNEASSRIQGARIHWIIGDLLQAGDSDEQQRKQAIEHFDRALQCSGLPTDVQVHIRYSRAGAILALRHAPPKYQDEAVRDLKAATSVDESNRAWSEKWKTIWDLARLFLSRRQNLEALHLLETAAAIALTEIKVATSDSVLLQKGAQFVDLFQDLAGAYVSVGKADQALAALETLRAAVIRLNTMPTEEKKERELEALTLLAISSISKHEGLKQPHAMKTKLELEPAVQRTKALADKIGDSSIAFLSYACRPPTVTVVVVTVVDSTQGCDGLQWEMEESAWELLISNNWVELGPLREDRLKRACRSMYEALVAPLMPNLREKRISTIVVSAPGILSHLPFEAFWSGNPPMFVGSEFEVFYLPSLALGADIVASIRVNAEARLLIVGYQGHDLPGAQAEIAAIQESWKGEVAVVKGDDCTKRRVLEELQGEYDYIHFTCHGTFNPLRPIDSALHLVPDARRDSHRITAADLLKIRFKNSPLVTLSACSSALTSYDASNNCVGLTGSFFRAGARAIVGSRWPVYDRAAEVMLTAMYRRLCQAKVLGCPRACFLHMQREMSKSMPIEDWASFGYLGVM